MSPAAPRLAAVLLAGASVLPLAGCTTTQDKSAELAKNAKQAAAAKRFQVGKTNRDLKVVKVTTLKGDGANAVAVKIENSSRSPQVVVPIGLDLYDAKKTSLYTNRQDGLDTALNNIPVAEPGTTWWVNNQLPGTTAARTRVRIGTSRTKVPASLPKLRISGVKLTTDAGVHVARGKVENLSAIEQRRLTIFGVALKGGNVVAAGRAVVEKVAAKGGKAQRFNVYFTGDPTGAQLELSAPPSTL